MALVDVSAAFTSTNGTLSQTYALPAGDTADRVLIVTIQSSRGSGTTGEPADFTVAYGGVSIPVDGYEVAEQFTTLVGVIPLNQVFANDTLAITGANAYHMAVQAWVFDNVDTTQANLTRFLAAYAATGTTAVGPISVPTLGDLVFTVAGIRDSVDVQTIANSGFQVEDQISNDQDAKTVGGFSTTASGSQTLTWNTGADHRLTALVLVLPQAAGGGGGSIDTFNCACEDVSPYRTLAELRLDFMVGAGYSSQALNPPTGMVRLIDYYLNQAQAFLWLRYKEARGIRFFKWQMARGQRYYGIKDSSDGDSETGICSLKLDPLKVTWVGFEDLNRSWVRLVEGIPPEFYTRVQTAPGWPAYYEIRSCIEIFPAPQAPYTLWVKGNFDMTPLIDPTDRTSIDDWAVLWYALGSYKLANGKPDGNALKAQALSRITDIVAGQHNTARFVPSPARPLPPMTPPRFIPLGTAPS